jgi:hypothetical protein
MRPLDAMRIAFILAGASWVAGPCAAQTDRGLLRSEFWADLEPVAGVGEEWPVGPDEARRRILDEASWIFGGMIWGFEFSYTPYDRTRAVDERFDIAPIRTLAPDAPRLVPGLPSSSTTPELGGKPPRLNFIVEYRPDADLVSLMESYASDPWKGAQGIGKADMNLGVKGRQAAYLDGLRTAVRSYLRLIEPNKPRLVKGRVVFDRPPSIAILGGSYTCQVRARVMVVEMVPYKIY